MAAPRPKVSAPAHVAPLALQEQVQGQHPQAQQRPGRYRLTNGEWQEVKSVAVGEFELLCSDHCEEGWQQIELFHQEQQILKRLQRAEAKQSQPRPSVTFAALKAADLLPDDQLSDKSPASEKKRWRPAPDHPWRNDKVAGEGSVALELARSVEMTRTRPRSRDPLS